MQGCGVVKGLDDLLKPTQVRTERSLGEIPAKEAAVLAEQIWRLQGGEHARLTVQEVSTTCVHLGWCEEIWMLHSRAVCRAGGFEVGPPDPAAGLVEETCIVRRARQAAHEVMSTVFLASAQRAHSLT